MKSLLKYFLLSSILLLGGCNHPASLKRIKAMGYERLFIAHHDLSFFITPSSSDTHKDFFEVSATEIEEKDEEFNHSPKGDLTKTNYSASFFFKLFEYCTVINPIKNNLQLYGNIPYNPSCKYLFLQVFRL